MSAVASVIDKEYHAELLARKDEFARMAGIPVSLLLVPLQQTCTPSEVEWLRSSFRGGYAGACLLGKHTPPAEDKLMAMGAAYLRNYINAQVATLTAVLEDVESYDGEGPRVLIIPRFCATGSGKSLPAWQVQRLADLMFDRYAAGKLTIISAPSLSAVEAAYGDSVRDHIKTHYFLSD